MLRTNVATRPFYNERLVHAVLALVAAAAVALTVFNVTRIVGLSSRQGAVSAEAARAETGAASVRQAADAVRRSVNGAELEAVTAAAREANAIIDQRTFSWTALFNQFETTLPDDVRIVSVAPRVDRDGRMLVLMVVEGRRSEDVEGFVAQLEATGSFANVLSRQESVNEEGLLETVLEGQYLRRPAAAATGGRP